MEMEDSQLRLNTIHIDSDKIIICSLNQKLIFLFTQEHILMT